MNKRLQKKCVIVSVGLHLLLMSILLVGPAFLSSSSKTVDLPILDFVPLKTIDGNASGGGSLTGGPPPPPAPKPPAPTPPAPTPPPTPAARTPAPPETVKPQESLEVSPKTKKREISTDLITRTPDAKADAKAKADAQTREDARALAARQALARQIGSLASRLGSEMSGGTSIELKGPGGGGVPYANFLQAVKTVYENAWIVPDGVDDNATTGASVTIARDGSVVSSRITRTSGSPEADRSVQRTLDRVKFAAPLPDDAKEDKRTVDINFNVKAKRGLG